jgi:aldehyde dehydrogenase (NAD+)
VTSLPTATDQPQSLVSYAIPDDIDHVPPGAFDPVQELLRSGQDAGLLRTTAARKAALRAVLAMLNEHDQDFVDALRDDLRRPRVEAMLADLASVKAEIKFALKHVGAWQRGSLTLPPAVTQPGLGRRLPEPRGVVLVVAPWNYPIQLGITPLVGALAAGNSVLLKPSELAPASSAVLARLLPQYLDPRVVQVVEGGVKVSTELLAMKWDHIFFTGSTRVGRVVMQAAAQHLTPVTLELGGKSPAIVAADADLAIAARRILWGKFLNAGQTCIAPDYALVEASVRDAFVDQLRTAAEEFFGGKSADASDYGRIVNRAHFDRIVRLIDTAGGAMAVGGARNPDTLVIEPTVIVDPDAASAIMDEEIFGPVLPVVTVDSVEQACAFIRDRPKPLALYLFTGSRATKRHVLANTSSGGVCINQVIMHLGDPRLPFGGVGDSGMGAYHGKAGFDALSHHKSVLYKPQRPDLRLIYPPYSDLKEKILRRVM